MGRPREWDPPYQDDREEVLMIDAGQDPAATRDALVMARRALSVMYQADPKLYDKLAGPVQALINQLPPEKTRSDYMREQEAKAQARRSREAADKADAAREAFDQLRNASARWSANEQRRSDGFSRGKFE